MDALPKLPVAHITELTVASERVSEAVAEFKTDVELTGAMRSLSWEEAFALAQVGAVVREAPGSTYTTARLVFDGAQRTSFAWYFEPKRVDQVLDSLVRKGLLAWEGNCLQALLTTKGEQMLLSAGKALAPKRDS